MNLRYLNEQELENKGYAPAQIKDITETINLMNKEIYELRGEIATLESAIVRNFIKNNCNERVN